MSDASRTATDLLMRHAVTADHQLALPVDPVAIARAEGVRMRNVYDAFDRWDAAVDLGRALKPDGADPGWATDFAYALLMPAEIVRVMFASDLNTPEMACRFDVPWCRVRRRLAMLGLYG